MAQSLQYNTQVVQGVALTVPTLDQDLDNIQKLDDEPNDIGGLTAAQLKAEFDRAGNTIASYLNDQLIPAVLAADATEEQRALAEAERVSNEAERVANEIARQAAGERQIRKNLLDNWYFAGGGQFPINQRGADTYTGIGYTADRWKVHHFSGAGYPSSVTTVLGTDGIIVSNNGAGRGFFGQTLERLPVGIYTVSLLYERVSGEYPVAHLNVQCTDFTQAAYADKWLRNEESFASVTFSIQSDAQPIIVGVNVGGANSGLRALKIKAIKLEPGSAQTLAHQENGVWVLNELPNYQQELAKCQRYQFQVAPNNLSAGEYLIAGTGVLTALGQSSKIFIPTPVTMAKKPTVSYSGDWWVRAKEDGNAVTGMEVDGWSNAGISLYVSHESMSGDSVTLESSDDFAVGPPTGKILFDANL